jgi:membrane-associated protease RseP (regulator of RpoE activity)
MNIAELNACVGGLGGPVVGQRGWIGGRFQLAKRGDTARWDGGDDRVPAFPQHLNIQPKAGIFVESVYTNTPLALAGIHEGDLILRVDHKPVGKMKQIRKVIDNSRPGSTVSLSVFRDGRVNDHTVTIGRETFKPSGYFAMGFGFSTKMELDLLPDPDFALIALGYSRNERRIELNSPQFEFVRRVQAQNQEPPESGAGSIRYEGWNAWLAIFSVGSRKMILSQQAVNSTEMAAAGP